MNFFKRNRRQDPRPTDEPPQESLSGDLTERFAGLNERNAIAELHTFNQAELTAIHTFERSHRNRDPVLDKLRYLRQKEPMPGYDALDSDTVAAALADADPDTIKAVREYERKHQNRPTVNNAVLGALRESRKRQPASANGSIAPLLKGAQQPVVGNGLPIKVEPESGIGTP